MDWNFADNGSGLWNLRLFGDVVRAELSGSGTRQLDLSVPHGDHGHDYSVELARGGNLPRIAPWRVGGELRWERGPLRASLGAERKSVVEGTRVSVRVALGGRRIFNKNMQTPRPTTHHPPCPT